MQLLSKCTIMVCVFYDWGTAGEVGGSEYVRHAPYCQCQNLWSVLAIWASLGMPMLVFHSGK